MTDKTTPKLAPDARDALARRFADLALVAGRAVMDVYAGAIVARAKADSSPVTEADERAEAIILEGLAAIEPGLVVVAEESCARDGAPAAARRFALVDPVDGTKEFLARNGEFTINIALVEGDAPVVGCVYAPALGRLWIGGARAYVRDTSPGAERAGWRPIAVRAAPAEPLAMISRTHCDAATLACLDRLGVERRAPAGSSLKFCRLAEGSADIYPRLGRTNEWDTAAGHAVLLAAGGSVETLDGAPLRYGKDASGYRNDDFVAWGDPALRARRAALRSP